MDLENTEAVIELSTPKNAIDVISFIGLVGYYRRFIKRFSKIAHSVTSLQIKNVKFSGLEKCEASFQQLKKLLTNALVLKIADPKKYFVVCIDACMECLCNKDM